MYIPAKRKTGFEVTVYDKLFPRKKSPQNQEKLLFLLAVPDI